MFKPQRDLAGLRSWLLWLSGFPLAPLTDFLAIASFPLFESSFRLFSFSDCVVSSSSLSLLLIVYFYPSPLLFFSSLSIYPFAAPPSLDSPGLVQSPSCTTSTPLPALLHEHLPCPTDTTRCSHPPKTTSNRHHHQRPQSVSQAVSQPASKAAFQPAFCFDLKLLSSPVAGLLSSSDTHQRSS